MSELLTLKAMIRAEKPKFAAICALEKALPNKRRLVTRVTALLLDAVQKERTLLWMTVRCLQLTERIAELQHKIDSLEQEYAEERTLRRQLADRLWEYTKQERYSRYMRALEVDHA